MATDHNYFITLSAECSSDTFQKFTSRTPIRLLNTPIIEPLRLGLNMIYINIKYVCGYITIYCSTLQNFGSNYKYILVIPYLCI